MRARDFGRWVQSLGCAGALWRLALLLVLTCSVCLAGCLTPDYQVEFVAGGDPATGRALYTEYGCVACHAGVNSAEAYVGPPLYRWAQRSYIAGRLPNSPQNLVVWLKDPQAVNPQTAMPNLNISDQDALDLSAFLFTLR